MTIHDISVILGEQNSTYPGDRPFVRESTGPIPGIKVTEESNLSLSAHAGTHLDAPAHFIPGGKHLDDYTPADFIMPAQVVEILNPEAVTVDDLEDVVTQPGEALLFRTGNSHSGRVVSGYFSDRYVYISGEAAQWCVDRQLKLVGLDYISVDQYGDSETPAHNILLGAGLLALEAVNLAEVRPGRYTLICLPLRLKGAEGSPVRAVLVEGSL
ncbi:MAG: cyclase family protein [Armatimonadetes bacterium]|nr:cyclase family protein [Armatimonadota bacterium]